MDGGSRLYSNRTVHAIRRTALCMVTEGEKVSGKNVDVHVHVDMCA